MFCKIKRAWDAFNAKPSPEPSTVPLKGISKAEQIKEYMIATVLCLPTGDQIYKENRIEEVIATLMGVVYIATEDLTARAAVGVLGYDVLNAYTTSKVLTHEFLGLADFSADRNAEICSYLHNKMNKELPEVETNIIKDSEAKIFNIIEQLTRGK